VAANAELKVDKFDFISHSPFFPDAPRFSRDFANRFPPIDGKNVALAKAEEKCVHDFEVNSDYRRELMIEIEQQFSTIHQYQFSNRAGRKAAK
jgi:hypothetical protein